MTKEAPVIHWVEGFDSPGATTGPAVCGAKRKHAPERGMPRNQRQAVTCSKCMEWLKSDTVHKLQEKAARLERERDEALEALAAEHDHCSRSECKVCELIYGDEVRAALTPTGDTTDE